MPEQTKPCPQCGGELHLRLGEYQCSGCSYTETPAKPGAARGDEGRQTWMPNVGTTLPSESSRYTGQIIAPQPQAASGAAPPPSPAAGIASWEKTAYRGTLRDVVDALRREKVIYFVIYCTLQLLSVIGLGVLAFVMRATVYSANAAAANVHGPSAQLVAAIPALVLLVLIGALLMLALTWWALFGREAWVKWGCLGYAVLGALSSLASIGQLVFAAALLEQTQLPMLGAVRAALIASSALQACWQLWLVAILYRDIQQLQQYR